MALKVGDNALFSKTITEDDVYTFAGVTGDFNPIHVNDEYAKDSIFKKRIAHGFLVGSMISAVIGTKMPGEGTIYLEQDMTFCKPVFIGDTCTAKATICEVINKEKGIYRIETCVYNQKNEIVIDGSAIVKYKEDIQK